MVTVNLHLNFSAAEVAEQRSLLVQLSFHSAAS